MWDAQDPVSFVHDGADVFIEFQAVINIYS